MLRIQHRQRLFLKRPRVGVDLGRVEHRAGARAAARIAYPCRVVADDQHDRVAEVLELAQLLQHDREAEMDVRRGRVDPELDPQRTAQRKLAFELPFRQAIDRVSRQPRGRIRRRG